jgi:hypothetical protein
MSRWTKTEVDVHDDDGDYFFTREVWIPTVYEQDPDTDLEGFFIAGPDGLPISFPFSQEPFPMGFQPPHTRE